MSFIEIEITNWKKYNPREDIKYPTWFAFNNRMVEDSDFYDMPAEEFKAWVYLLSQASKKKSSKILVNFTHADRVCNIKEKHLRSCIDRLIRTGSVQITNAIRTGSEQHNTIQYNTNIYVDPGSPDELCIFELWNSYRGRMPEVKSQTEKRKRAASLRWKEKPDRAYWQNIIQKLAASKFCNGGGDRGWVADIDFLLRPDTHVKVSEGKFDNRTNEPELKPWVPT